MEATEKVKLLQTIYAGALADSVLRLGSEGVLEKVTQQKRAEQMAGGKVRAAQLGISSPAEVFTKLADLMGCANWTVSLDGDGRSIAVASRCMLCTLARRMGAQSPCRIYCLDPMEGMIKGLDEDAEYDVQSTLFDGSECRVAITATAK